MNHRIQKKVRPHSAGAKEFQNKGSIHNGPKGRAARFGRRFQVKRRTEAKGHVQLN